MLFRQFVDADLGCASYLVADGGAGAIVDPNREIEQYLELADEHGFEIRHVLETHNHADHVSGHGRLVAATGAAVHVSRTPGLDVPARDARRRRRDRARRHAHRGARDARATGPSTPRFPSTTAPAATSRWSC